MTNTTHDPFAPIAPKLKTASPCTLVITEKGLSLIKQEVIVKDTKNKILFKVTSSLFSMGHHRTIHDAKGKRIGQVRRKNAPFSYETFYMGTMDDDTRCSMKMKNLLNFDKCEADLYLGADVIGEVSGEINSTAFSIKINNTIVADVKKKANTSLLVEDETFRININQGVDSAFVVMIMIVFHEMYENNRK